MSHPRLIKADHVNKERKLISMGNKQGPILLKTAHCISSNLVGLAAGPFSLVLFVLYVNTIFQSSCLMQVFVINRGSPARPDKDQTGWKTETRGLGKIWLDFTVGSQGVGKCAAGKG